MLGAIIINRRETMNEKMKSCFAPHSLMHSLFGLGLGILVATLIPGLQLVWLGVVLMVISVILDLMRKS